ncbi:carboxymuconolactone decarboxylase family protein [Agrobacterium sp. LAD9]|uniref:carboxymuconolactone decarboxylase family protein n=1 Tax=Agrobacterium sp. LAD9 TaxID=2055153 RepID=UPI000D1E3C19|nr:carboxymuconolactone decarboxylase family protein [Agrobacterium sp. LAD9]
MRLAGPDLDNLDTEQKRVYDLIAGGPRGRVRGPLALWLHRPLLAEAAQSMGQYCRYDSSVAPRLSEIAILALVRLWNAELPWYAHKADALKAGVEPEVIEAIRLGREPQIADAAGRAVYRFAVEIINERKVSDKTYAAALEALGSDGVVDLVGIIGYYSLVAMTVNTFELPLPEGVHPDFPG